MQPPVAAPRPPPVDANAIAQQGLTPAMQKQLMARVTALSSAKGGIPERASLRNFWLEVEEAVTSLTPAIDNTAQLTQGAIRRLAPYVLGAPLWAQLSGQGFIGWSDFRALVDAEVGLTEEEERCEFYSLTLGPWERDEDFILRVEARRKLVVPYDPTSNLVYIFAPRLTVPFRLRLEHARSAKALHSGGALQWDDVIKVAKDVKYAAKLITD